ncbi:hypothetical protein OAF97_01395 [Akkermansiaceae bacterium]|nr:hypothetical protein [Akkermansiaceae bacterium]
MIYLHIAFSVFVFLTTNSLAVFSFYLMFVSLGLFITRKSQEGKSIFSGFFLIYTIYATLVYYYRDFYGLEFVHASDQTGFYLQSEILGETESFIEFAGICLQMVLVNWNGGSAFIFGSISYLAKNIFHGNHLLLHLYSVCFSAGLIQFYLHKTLRLYYNRKKSTMYTIIFGLLSYSFYYSGFMLRDVYIALLFMIAVWIYHEKELKSGTILKLVILSALTYTLRDENGLFMLTIVFAYIYKTRASAKKSFLIASALLGGLLLSGFFVSVYYNTLEVLAVRNEVHVDRINDESGLVTTLYKLPRGLREISIITFNLISPFPFWSFFKGKVGDILFINNSLAGIFSFYMNGFIVLSVIFFRKNLVIRKGLIYLTAIAYLLIVLNLASLDTRRIFYMYPVLFILFLNMFNQIKRRKVINKALTYLYISLIMIYLILKY